MSRTDLEAAPASASASPDPPSVDPERTLPGGLATAGAGVALLAVGGPVGGVAALAALVCWYWLGPTYAFAVGQVGLVAVALDAPVPWLAGAQAAVLAVLVAPDLTSLRDAWLAAGTVAGTALLGGLAYLALVAWDELWAAAVVLLAAGALAGYGLHRYELVATGGVDVTGE